MGPKSEVEEFTDQVNNFYSEIRFFANENINMKNVVLTVRKPTHLIFIQILLLKAIITFLENNGAETTTAQATEVEEEDSSGYGRKAYDVKSANNLDAESIKRESNRVRLSLGSDSSKLLRTFQSMPNEKMKMLKSKNMKLKWIQRLMTSSRRPKIR